ncbi:uncharacterized protein LOC115998557 [Ipomoea triloba]|uniref:uncharacterized protein LOC115998557 n=1 Tax=Ipomoea triloba TaxID=35885 RepID=UPI00125E59B8|nr:uncharacterized protein LOC115998557 [Ipomoea triloba]
MAAINRPPSFITNDNALSAIASSSSSLSRFSTVSPLIFTKFPPRPRPLTSSSLPRRPLLCSKPSGEAELSGTGDEWLERLPDKKKPLYAHSLPCIEAWLKSLGFYQSKDDRALWFVENPDWHAQLSLDATDLYIRYLKSGPGILEKDVERRFSYALSREDIENAILGGP